MRVDGVDTHQSLMSQLERIGFFVVDKDSTLIPASGSSAAPSLVLNLTVSLKDSKPKVAGAPNRSRKEEQERQLAEKKV